MLLNLRQDKLFKTQNLIKLMKRGYIVYPVVVVSLILTPATAYDGRKGISGYSSTHKYENKNPRKESRFLNGIKRYIRKNPDGITKKLMKIGDPTKATGYIFDTLKRRKNKKGSIPNTGVIRRHRR